MRHQNEKYIITASEEELKNRLRHVKMAVNSWKENKRNVNEQFAKSQVKFFSDEEKLIEKRLKALAKNKKITSDD